MSAGRIVCGLCAASLALLVPSSLSAATLLIDFSRADGVNGNATVGPDVNGNYWNNVVSPGGVQNFGANTVTVTDMVTTDNVATTIDIVNTTPMSANGRNNGGLLAPNGPSPALLGDFAIETATEDYFFTDNSAENQRTGNFLISGLNPAAEYSFRMFATRVTSDSDLRDTQYDVTGGNGTQSVVLRTSGDNIGSNGTYDGNDDLIVSIDGVTPDAMDSINLTMIALQPNSNIFGYLGILEITETVVPEPSSAVVALVGLFGLAAARRR